jgi:hypothetical protein
VDNYIMLDGKTIQESDLYDETKPLTTATRVEGYSDYTGNSYRMSD